MKRTILTAISFIALFEFICGAIFIDGGHFALGICAMVMPLAWFWLILLKHGR